MIVLDTNVISEAFRPAPNTEVGEWLRLQPKDKLFVTSVNRAEVLTGLALMPDGKRKELLAEAISAFFDDRLLTPILAFDDEAAFQYARIFSQRRKSGRPIAELDCQIAAIALVHGHAVATRNVWNFEHCGIEVINPWDAQPQ